MVYFDNGSEPLGLSIGAYPNTREKSLYQLIE
jgi:hypothetical protein